MTQAIRALWVCAVAASCLAAAVLAGANGADARAAAPAPAPVVCCIYMIF